MEERRENKDLRGGLLGAALHVQGIGLDRCLGRCTRSRCNALSTALIPGPQALAHLPYGRMSFASSALRRLGQEGPRLARGMHVGRTALGGGYVSQAYLALSASAADKMLLALALCCGVSSSLSAASG